MTDPSDLTHELAVEVCHPLKASVDRSIPMQETTSVDYARTRTLLVPRGDRKAVKWDLDVECAKCQKAVGLTISQHSVMFLRAKDLPAGTRIERTLSRRFLKGELLAAAFITVFWLAAAFALLWYFLRFDVWSPVVIGVAASTWIVLLVYLALAGLKNWRIGEGLIVVESHEFPEHQAPRANCTAPGFLDSGLTVFASTLPRPARRGRVAPGRGFDSRISPASTVRCMSA